ncbi:MAG: L,D-transpeptidase family protein [Verrucomicrobiales bacterium]|nr:L,D-transpeptidase family protein [Verrucomicrobiales bacterium]
MKRTPSLIKGISLGIFNVLVIGGLVVTDYYLRHEPTRKAVRFLESQGIAIDSDSATRFASKGNLPMLELLETAGVDLTAPDSRGITPFMTALRANHEKAREFFLIRREVVKQINEPAGDDKVNALGHAIREGDLSLADRFLKMGAHVDVEIEPGIPVLLGAVRDQDMTLYRFLTENGADVNLQGQADHSALAYAFAHRNQEMINGLIEKGAKVNVNGLSGEPLIVETVLAKDHDLTKLLINNGAEVNLEERPPIAIAIAHTDGWLIQDLLEAGADPNVESLATNDRLVFKAINAGNHDLANLLLEHGADPDAVSSSGQTALAIAVQASDLVMVDLLLGNGADPDFSGEGHPCPLALATAEQDVAMMRELISAGANPRDDRILIDAFENRDFPGLRLLLQSGANPEAFDEKGRRILDMAVASGSVESARMLLASGADANGKLWSALRTGNDELVNLVLAYGADVSEFDRLGGHPLSFALKHKNYEIMETLLEGGANPNLMRNDTEAWIATAIREGDGKMANLLLDYGACTNGLKSEDGHSLLGWAIAHDFTKIAVRLIDEGADVRAREPAPATSAFREKFDGKTFKYHLLKDSRINPLMLAAANKNHDVAQALMDGGAKASDYSRKYLWPVNIGAWYADTKMMQIILGRDPDPNNQPRKIVIDLSAQKATLYENGRATYTTPVSTGMRGYRTPTGEYVITDKHRHHTSSIYGSSMPYFQRLSCAAFGFHQGSLPGYPASHGCIRMTWAGAKHLFYKCEIGDLVTIQY